MENVIDAVGLFEKRRKIVAKEQRAKKQREDRAALIVQQAVFLLDDYLETCINTKDEKYIDNVNSALVPVLKSIVILGLENDKCKK